MTNLDVFELAKQVNADSLSGALTEHLLSEGNDLYEPAQTCNKLRRTRPNGEISEGYFQNGEFVIEKTLACARKE